jgi:hypothetical protein
MISMDGKAIMAQVALQKPGKICGNQNVARLFSLMEE